MSAFVEAGASVIATDIDDEGLTEISKKHHRTKLKTRRLDISDYNAVNDTIIDSSGIDILINNAACSMGLIRDDHLNRLVSIDEVSPQMWNRFVATNLSGAWYLTKAVIPHMRQVGWGRIINVTGKRFVAANWDDNASVADARANSESLIAWPELANNPVWPGGKPTT